MPAQAALEIPGGCRLDSSLLQSMGVGVLLRVVHELEIEARLREIPGLLHPGVVDRAR